MFETNSQNNNRADGLQAGTKNLRFRGYFAVIGIVLVVCLIVAGLYAFFRYRTNKPGPDNTAAVLANREIKPVSIIQVNPGLPQAYSVETYKDLPQDFPASLWMDKTSPDHIDIVRRTGGDSQVTVVFSSPNSIDSVISAEKPLLAAAGWTVTRSIINSKVGVINAGKGRKNLTITVVPASAGIQATFQLAMPSN